MRLKWVVNKHVTLVTECPHCGDFINYEPGDTLGTCYSCKSIFGVLPWTTKFSISWTKDGIVTVT